MTNALSMMNRRCSILRPQQSVDATGTPTLVFVTVRSKIPCAVDQMSGNEAKRYDRETSVKLFSGIFPNYIGLIEKDRVLIASFGTFEVLNVYPVAGSDGATDYIEAALELQA